MADAHVVGAVPSIGQAEGPACRCLSAVGSSLVNRKVLFQLMGV